MFSGQSPYFPRTKCYLASISSSSLTNNSILDNRPSDLGADPNVELALSTSRRCFTFQAVVCAHSFRLWQEPSARLQTTHTHTLVGIHIYRSILVVTSPMSTVHRLVHRFVFGFGYEITSPLLPVIRAQQAKRFRPPAPAWENCGLVRSHVPVQVRWLGRSHCTAQFPFLHPVVGAVCASRCWNYVSLSNRHRQFQPALGTGTRAHTSPSGSRDGGWFLLPL